MKSRLIATACVFLLCFAASSTGNAHPEILVVKGDGDYAPYEIIHPDHNVSGLHMDMVTAVADRLGIHITFLPLPWKRALDMIQKGEADAITYMSKTPERSQFAIFFEGNILSQVQNGFFTLKSRVHEFQYTGDINTLKTHTIGMLAGYNYGPEFSRATFRARDAGAVTEKQLIRKLLNQRFDVGIGFVTRIQYLSKEMGLEGRIVFLRPFLQSIPQYIAFSRHSPNASLAASFAEEMALFKLSWEYKALLNRYGLDLVN